jgi:AraC-like DNA-binding protein/quercetin dioxygenase-like cupin family protein
MPFYEGKHRMDAKYFEIENGENLCFAPHIHRCYEVITVSDGTLELTVDGVTYALVPGDVALIFPNQVHAFHTPQRSRHRLIIFSPEVIAAFDRHHSQQLPSEVVVTLGKQHPLCSMLLSLQKEDGLFAVKGVLYSICAAFERAACFTDIRRGRGNNLSLLREILTFVQCNFMEECTLAALAAAIKYDMTYLSKFFVRNVGISFTEYVHQIRTSHACYLLQNTDKTILQISHECGSTSLRTFNRNFAAQMGCTPKEYRQGVRF